MICFCCEENICDAVNSCGVVKVCRVRWLQIAEFSLSVCPVSLSAKVQFPSIPALWQASPVSQMRHNFWPAECNELRQAREMSGQGHRESHSGSHLEQCLRTADEPVGADEFRANGNWRVRRHAGGGTRAVE